MSNLVMVINKTFYLLIPSTVYNANCFICTVVVPFLPKFRKFGFFYHWIDWVLLYLIIQRKPLAFKLIEAYIYNQVSKSYKSNRRNRKILEQHT